MKNLIYFCLGVLLTVSVIAVAQTQNISLFKPAVPSFTTVGSYANVDKLKEGLTFGMQNKWTVKSVVVNPETSGYIVVYESYSFI